MLSSKEIRQRFVDFFKKRGHSILPSASLIPENDPTVLFNTAGMQPLVPFLMGNPHPQGDKLANIQKCVRTTDIDDVGDKTHATFFEMMGNWSLGSYFKEDAIKWSYEFLTSKEEGLGLDPSRLYVTVFEGDENASRDEEAARVWENVGIPKNRIYFKGADSNWWPAVKGKDTWTGPTGPCSEMFYDITKEGLGDLTKEEYIKADEEQKVVEVWNDVFMEFEKKDGKIISKLKQKNVDTGAGFERLCAVVQEKESIFDTDVLKPMMDAIEVNGIAKEVKAQRIIADHIRTAIFMISEGVLPSNTDRGYILRRLIRRAVFNTLNKTLSTGDISILVNTIIDGYSSIYEDLINKGGIIKQVLEEEVNKFAKTIVQGLKEFEKIIAKKEINGEDAFNLYQSYGLPFELTQELAKEKGLIVDRNIFDQKMKEHEDKSRLGSELKFKGGLADTSEISKRYHTATHLLHKALREVLGEHVEQKGSNITTERLRFDFVHPNKMTDEEKKKVEDIVNQKIQEGLDVNRIELPKEEAEKTGALHFFSEKYGDIVSIYYIGPSIESAYSKEFCGGPHVSNTKEIGKFEIVKEEAVSAGVRRIKAVVK